MSKLSFITNEDHENLMERFSVLIKDTSAFDCLVGYFYASGFHAIYPALTNTKKIRILIGMKTDTQVWQMLQQSKEQQLDFHSHAQVKKNVVDDVRQEMTESVDNQNVEQGVATFIEWLKSKRLELRVYRTQNIHAKVYIMTFTKDDRDMGRVITGSSNFTQAGLINNIEFNVELRRSDDYQFALTKFNELWDDSVDVSEEYRQTLQTKTWFNPNIMPYQLYLKFLYEYFKDQLEAEQTLSLRYQPSNFKPLEYQKQAVFNAKKILLAYNGVFIADVVGLGKTYVATMLAGELDGRTLVIAPPALIRRENPGSWPNVFNDFKLQVMCQSLGKLDALIKQDISGYKNIIIDEAHRFRNQATDTYEKLAIICRNKRVILVTATPYNNKPEDILSLLKLFQKEKKSTIPNLANLTAFFSQLASNLKAVDRKKDYQEYLTVTKKNADEIREKLLKYLMVRRTRAEIKRFFPEDKKKQGLKFPTVKKPTALFYQLNKKEDKIFTKTIKLITQELTYARYQPLTYHSHTGIFEQQSQKNMGTFMKILLIKRLESSFFAFGKTIERFLRSYTGFLRAYDAGSVYISKKHTQKIFEFLEDGEDQLVHQLIEDDKASRYPSKDFNHQLKDDLHHDHRVLTEIEEMWKNISRDPKLEKFIRELKKNPVLRKNHLIIFTESMETASYLAEQIKEVCENKVLLFTGSSSDLVRHKVIENFDARAYHPANDFRVLISTEVLAEGVNLHRANVVINYDIPWNPTRMMQRVGRINRMDTKFAKIHTFNFFPTVQSNDEIQLKEVAEAKITAFLTLLGGDAELLTEGEPIASHKLFDYLNSLQALEPADEGQESELKYLQMIREIKENQADLYEQIKKLPQKARSAKALPKQPDSLLTYFRRGSLQKFFLTQKENMNKPQELDFMNAAALLASEPQDKRQRLAATFYDLLNSNKTAFVESIQEQPLIKESAPHSASHYIERVIKITLKNKEQIDDKQKNYFTKILNALAEGSIAKQTLQKTKKALEGLGSSLANPTKIVKILHENMGKYSLESIDEQKLRASQQEKPEIILSLYLTNGE